MAVSKRGSPSVLSLDLGQGYNLTIIITSLGFDLSMTNGLQSVDIFMNNFGNPHGASLGFYGASMFLGGKVIVGLGASFAQLGGSVLITELSRPKTCAFLSSFYNTNTSLGFLSVLELPLGHIASQVNGPGRFLAFFKLCFPSIRR